MSVRDHRTGRAARPRVNYDVLRKGGVHGPRRPTRAPDLKAELQEWLEEQGMEERDENAWTEIG